MGFIKRVLGFFTRPSHSRTIGIALVLLLGIAVFFTVSLAQQSQTLRQHASGYNCGGSAWINPDWDCFSAANDCNWGLCKGTSGGQDSCQSVPKDNGSVCTAPDGGPGKCTNGTCSSTASWECGNAANPDWNCFSKATDCATGKCNTTSHTCYGEPKNEGGSCNNGTGKCSGGSCVTNAPTTYTCQSSGGQCIPMAPCNLGYDYYGTGGTLCPSPNIVCCMPMTATPTIYVQPTVYVAPTTYIQPTRYVAPTTYIAPTTYVQPTTYVAPTTYIAPTSYLTPTVTPIQISSVTLVSALNAQDATFTTDTIDVDLTLYSLTTNNQVSGAPATQTYTKTSIPGRQYSTNITLTNLASGKYFIIIRKDNMIAKSVFDVSSSGQTITVPTTTLVFGDLDNNNDINIVDYNIFKGCWKQEAAGSCLTSNFIEGGNIVDQIDFNAWLKGLVTWTKEATGV